MLQKSTDRYTNSLAHADAPPLASRTPGRPKRVPRTPPPAGPSQPGLHSRSRSINQLSDPVTAAVQRTSSERLGDALPMLPGAHKPPQGVSSPSPNPTLNPLF